MRSKKRVSHLGGDHPREYGENLTTSTESTLTPGSSPRIRGKLRRVFRRGVRSGIIPANTGKMCVMSWFMIDDRDHPREYGENAC